MFKKILFVCFTIFNTSLCRNNNILTQPPSIIETTTNYTTPLTTTPLTTTPLVTTPLVLETIYDVPTSESLYEETYNDSDESINILIDMIPTLCLIVYGVCSFFIFKSNCSYMLSNRYKNLSVGFVITFLYFILIFFIYSLFSKDNLESLFGKIAIMFVNISLVSVSKTNIWKYVFNLSPERTTKFHILFGTIVLILSFIHGIFCLKDNDYVFDILYQYTITDSGVYPIYGLISFILVLLSAVISQIRRKRWDLFYNSHHVFILLLQIFLFLHTNFQVYYLFIIPYCLILVDITLYIYKRMFQYEINKFAFDNNTMYLEVKPQKHKLKEINEGNYFYMLIPGISLNKHPFSVTSSNFDNKYSFQIKKNGYGSWTHKLYNYLEELYNKENDLENSLFVLNHQIRTLHCNIPVYLFGPYGSLTINIKQTDLLLMFSNGIGITPMLSTCKKFLSNIEKQGVLVWIGKKGSFLIEREIKIVSEKYSSNLEVFSFTEKPNIREIFNNILIRYENDSVKNYRTISAMVCGSDSLTNEIENLCSETNIDVHKETFLL